MLRKVHTPADMMGLISESSVSTTCIPSMKVNWIKWKNLLSSLFRIPPGFKITNYHHFTVRKSEPGCVFAKRLHNSTEEDKFCFLKQKQSSSMLIAANQKTVTQKLFPNNAELEDKWG